MTTLGKALSVVNIAVQGLLSSLSLVVGVVQEIANGLTGFAAAVGNGFGWITDQIGLTENAAHQFDDTLQASAERAGSYFKQTTQSLKANQASISDSFQNLLGIQAEQSALAEHAAAQTQSQAQSTQSLNEALNEQSALLKDLTAQEYERANAAQTSAQEALRAANAIGRVQVLHPSQHPDFPSMVKRSQAHGSDDETLESVVKL